MRFRYKACYSIGSVWKVATQRYYTLPGYGHYRAILTITYSIKLLYRVRE